ncbi:unnamed protein product, partial [Phaeothamnion confervicola]
AQALKAGPSLHATPGTTENMAPQTSRPLQGSSSRTFEAWARSEGISFADLAQADFAGLRGLTASRPIAAGEALVTVPRHLLLSALLMAPPPPPTTTAVTSANVADGSGASVGGVSPRPPPVPPAIWAAAPWWVRLALLLLWERARGAASLWAPYIEYLP